MHYFSVTSRTQDHIGSVASGAHPGHDPDLFPQIYSELRRLAAAQMEREAPGHTLQPTALVHEVWMALNREGTSPVHDHRHFMAKAAEAMRCLLIDRARRKLAVRHGGGLARVDLDSVHLAVDSDDETILAVNDALEKLAAEAPQKAELVKMRYFAGLSIDEAAEALGIARATANRWWTYARAWLLVELRAR